MPNVFFPYRDGRHDSDGMLWRNPRKEKKKGGGSVSTYRPEIPNTGWTVPKPEEFREFSRSEIVAIDIETKDPDIKTLGPGVRRDGQIVGVSVGTDDGWRRYFPVGHENAENLPVEVVKKYIVGELSKYRGPIVGANLLYDLDYLSAHWGVNPYRNIWHDVLVAEPLIDENSYTYNLERLAQKYLGEGKDDEPMYEWLAAVFGGKATRSDQAGNIWRAPLALAGPYAESDTDLPLRILREQMKVIESEELQTVWSVESRLTPMLLAMRQRGVRVDIARAEALNEQLVIRAEEFRGELSEHGIAGSWDRTGISAYCNRTGIQYPSSADGTGSFRSAFLEKHPDSVLKLVHEVRRLEKHGQTFVNNYIMKNHVNGRLHCLFHQLRSDSGGTVSGRFSSSHPNLQNIPARDEELGPMIRALWVPEPEEDWASDDYSQIEFRLAVHYGRGDSAERVRERYRTDPKVDFHAVVAGMCEIDRKYAKGINFGLVYGMGEPTMAAQLGRELSEVRPVFEQYHTAMPFIRELYDSAQKRGANRGYVKTLLGRRRRFMQYEAARWVDASERAKNPAFFAPCGKEEAIERHTRVRRSGTQKSLNAVLQGGAADFIKKAMVDIWEAGICDVLGAPLLQVHDELDWSIPRTSEAREAHRSAVQMMEQAIHLSLPLMVDSKIVENWGAAK